MINVIAGSCRDVLRLIRQNRCIERTRLARMIGVTHAGISKAINDLLAEGMIREAGQLRPEGRGRPSQTYRLAPGGAYAIGIAIKAERIELILIDWLHNVVAESKLPNRMRQPREGQAAVQQVIEEARRLVPKAARSRLLGVSLAVGGMFDARGDRPNTVRDMADVNQANALLEGLRSHLRTSAWFVNDVDASLLAERWAISEVPHPGHMIYVNDLLGFSILLDGQSTLSWLGTRRSLGRAQVQRDAKPSDPNLVGCLAETASIGSLIDRLSGRRDGALPPRSAEQWEREVAELFHRFDQGNPEVKQMIGRAFDDLGFVVRNLCVLFDLSDVVLEGWSDSIMAEGLQIVRRVLSEGSYPQLGGLVPTVRANSFGRKQQVLGAAISSIEHRLGMMVPLLHRGRGADTREPIRLDQARKSQVRAMENTAGQSTPGV